MDKLDELIYKVKLLHKQNDFNLKGGEDKYYRMCLLMEELGEICESLTKEKSNFNEEHADLLILLLGNCVAYNIDIAKLTSTKLNQLLKMKPIASTDGHIRLITKNIKKDLK